MAQILGGQSSVLAPPGESGLSSPSKPLTLKSMGCNLGCIQPSSNSIPGHFKGNSPAEAGQMDGVRGEGTKKQREVPQDALCLNPEPGWRLRAAAAPKQCHTHGPHQPDEHSSCPRRTGWKGKGDTNTPFYVLSYQQFSEWASRNPREPYDPFRGSARSFFDPSLHEWHRSHNGYDKWTLAQIRQLNQMWWCPSLPTR